MPSDPTDRPRATAVEQLRALGLSTYAARTFVDVDALDSLLTDGTDGLDESTRVTFEYAGAVVLVEATGEVTVRTSDERPSPASN